MGYGVKRMDVYRIHSSRSIWDVETEVKERHNELTRRDIDVAAVCT